MNKIISIIVLLFSIFSLTACNNDKEDVIDCERRIDCGTI